MQLSCAPFNRILRELRMPLFELCNSQNFSEINLAQAVQTLSSCFGSNQAKNDRSLGEDLARSELEYHNEFCNTSNLKQLRDSIKEIRYTLHLLLSSNEARVHPNVITMRESIEANSDLQHLCVGLYKRFVDLFIGLETGLSKQLDKWLCIQVPKFL